MTVQRGEGGGDGCSAGAELSRWHSMALRVKTSDQQHRGNNLKLRTLPPRPSTPTPAPHPYPDPATS